MLGLGDQRPGRVPRSPGAAERLWSERRSPLEAISKALGRLPPSNPTLRLARSCTRVSPEIALFAKRFQGSCTFPQNTHKLLQIVILIIVAVADDESHTDIVSILPPKRNPRSITCNVTRHLKRFGFAYVPCTSPYHNCGSSPDCPSSDSSLPLQGQSQTCAISFLRAATFFKRQAMAGYCGFLQQRLMYSRRSRARNHPSANIFLFQDSNKLRGCVRALRVQGRLLGRRSCA